MDLLIALLMFVTIWGGLTALLAWCIGKLARRWSKRRRYTVATVVAAIVLGALIASALMFQARVDDPIVGSQNNVQSQSPSIVLQAPPDETTAPPAESSDDALSVSPLPAPPRASAPEPPLAQTPAPSEGPNVPLGSAAGRPAPPLPTFPWPPPAPSASIVIPNAVVLRVWDDPSVASTLATGFYNLSEGARLGHVDGALRWSLARSGYWQTSYYAVPDGFALVARLERINEDGTSYPFADRWNATYAPMREFSIREYLRALFLAPPGYYRVIAFIVSAQPFSASDKRVSADEAHLWLERGANVLPADLANQTFRPEHACTALIYEFEKRDVSSDPFGRRPGRLAADTHIIKSKIGEALRWQFQ